MKGRRPPEDDLPWGFDDWSADQKRAYREARARDNGQSGRQTAEERRLARAAKRRAAIVATAILAGEHGVTQSDLRRLGRRKGYGGRCIWTDQLTQSLVAEGVLLVRPASSRRFFAAPGATAERGAMSSPDTERHDGTPTSHANDPSLGPVPASLFAPVDEHRRDRDADEHHDADDAEHHAAEPPRRVKPRDTAPLTEKSTAADVWRMLNAITEAKVAAAAAKRAADREGGAHE